MAENVTQHRPVLMAVIYYAAIEAMITRLYVKKLVADAHSNGVVMLPVVRALKNGKYSHADDLYFILSIRYNAELRFPLDQTVSVNRIFLHLQ